MNRIAKLILEDVRCFQGRQELDIRPLTFLIGENSTGKSTALGCLQILRDSAGDDDGIDFNSKPYQMGAFADIVRRSSPRTDCFKLGVEFHTKDNKPLTCLLSLREKETGSEPIIDEIQYKFDDGEITIIRKNKDTDSTHLKIKKYGENRFTITYNDSLIKMQLGLRFIEYFIFLLLARQHEKKKNKTEEKFLLFMQTKWKEDFNRISYGFFYDVHSFAPVRSKPKRTYDALKEIVTPEGDEIPMLLRNLKYKDKDRWEKLYKQLVGFGKASGLFSDIAVRELGRAMNDPFQLQIKVKGPKVNLMDVGYGVGQILPILVRILSTNRSAMFLLQQPEVHLHPRGQAELSSLLVSMCENSKHSFLVETHSDYMINRARILVRQKKIKSEDVSILYFESMKTKGAVKIHNIKVDAMGNIIDAPPNYREFFAKETDTLLGFDEE